MLSQFISPGENRRTDEYGGDTPRRARLAIEVVRADVYRQWKAMKELFKAAEKPAGLPRRAFVAIVCRHCKSCDPQKAAVLADAFPAVGKLQPRGFVDHGKFIIKVIALFGAD